MRRGGGDYKRSRDRGRCKKPLGKLREGRDPQGNEKGKSKKRDPRDTTKRGRERERGKQRERERGRSRERGRLREVVRGMKRGEVPFGKEGEQKEAA